MGKILLCTMEHCPRCKEIKDKLDELQIEYEIADEEKTKQMALKYKLRSVPFVITDKYVYDYKHIADILDQIEHNLKNIEEI